MRPLSHGLSASMRTEEGFQAVLVSADLRDSACIIQSVSSLSEGRIIQFEQLSDLQDSCPSGRIDLLVLASESDNPHLTRDLRRLRRKFSDSVLVVSAPSGSGLVERHARQAGAMFFVSPAPQEFWDGAVEGALRSKALTASS